MVRLNIYVATTALPVRGLSAGRMNHLLYINPNVLYFHSIPFIALLYFHVSNCICSRSHSHKPFSPSAYVQPIMYTREGVRVCARALIHVIQGVQTPPPSHFHYGQISGLCYSGVAFCRRAGSLITHTALLHFHFLFIQPPFHSGFIILPSELSSPVWVFAACWNDIISDLDKCLTVFPWVYNQTWGSVLQLWGTSSSSSSSSNTWLRNYFLRREVSHQEFAWESTQWIYFGLPNAYWRMK